IKQHKGKIVTTSRHIAKVFGKEHKHVLDAVRNAIKTTNEFAADFSATNFIQSTYKLKGREYTEYLLTKDGTAYTVMGFTGKKAAQFKVAYINKFNEMEEQLKNRQEAQLEYPALTDAIQALHEEPKYYHFTNENNMINRIVLGMSAKQFKQMHGIDLKEGSIRPYLNAEQIYYINMLQKCDTGLARIEPDYQKRKELLTNYYERLRLDRNLKALKSS